MRVRFRPLSPAPEDANKTSTSQTLPRVSERAAKQAGPPPSGELGTRVRRDETSKNKLDVPRVQEERTAPKRKDPREE